MKNFTIDIMIYSGDVEFKVKDIEDDDKISNYNKYFLSNKIFYQFNLEQTSYDNIEIEYYANYNSFFTIKYITNIYSLNQIEEFISSDESYLVQIDSSSEKIIKIFFYKIIELKVDNHS